ncbi:MAG: UvrB/UvrC motif-containing protein [bacterium]|nr:UvrB/UvrC motif-containing protein [bacterium]
MNYQELKNKNLPDTPGVYFFLGPKKASPVTGLRPMEILYIGKATSLRDRVKSYFAKDILHTRGAMIEKMVFQSVDITYLETQSVLEALILEASQIKKHLPDFNIKEKDNRSFNYVIFTDEDFPRVLVERGRDIAQRKEKKYLIKSTYGPFPHGGELREALRIIRKIFPYRDRCVPKDEQKIPEKARLCFNAQIGLCPGVCKDGMTKKEYRKRIKYLELLFEGKRNTLITELEKDMNMAAKKEDFESASKLKYTLYALDHIQDIALIKRDAERTYRKDIFRIEAYDIAHMSGKETVGVMVVVEDGELAKSQYRKFRIRGQKNSDNKENIKIDDTGNLKEVIIRRLGHLEWTLPNLIVIDGGVGQINAAKEVLKERNFNIEVVSVVKDHRHKPKDFLGSKSDIEKYSRSILLANAEAHRFAITYHRKLRSKGFRI